MSCVGDFWNEVVIVQSQSGQAPSVATKDMRKALDGDKEYSKKIESNF